MESPVISIASPRGWSGPMGNTESEIQGSQDASLRSRGINRMHPHIQRKLQQGTGYQSNYLVNLCEYDNKPPSRAGCTLVGFLFSWSFGESDGRGDEYVLSLRWFHGYVSENSNSGGKGDRQDVTASKVYLPNATQPTPLPYR
eukprot:203714-Amorphochlora_amoeboformis.AAC.1